ncbi:putative bifunctional diguanylate cyclase/phosphodiesterase [Iodobacter ciconiae]|uniref:GGDEF domain-containing protein n=1 Tax=Iodobacter ciconiae TaxID=2496266 RepID=A0A3S8ZU30_9NEIS|nr:GGDEF domain-containing phosphodiesterase [Iodobacter ciconiae]AZN36941.1 GGDEF domain-containing protein [Iodobacter ciconiae]
MKENAPANTDLAILASYQLNEQFTPQLETLIQTHCQAVDQTLYQDYFQALIQGKALALWSQLSPHGLNLSTLLLLGWRELILQYLPTEANAPIDRLCLAELAKPQQYTLSSLQTSSPAHGLENAKRHTQAGRSIALLYIKFGHIESLCPNTSQPLNEMLRQEDRLYPLENGLLLILPNMAGEGHSLLAANRAQQLLAHSFTEHSTNLRIGIALWPEHGQTAKQLILAAQAAAKHCSNEEPAIYQAKRDIQGRLLGKLEKPLRDALAQNRFHLAFQPQLQPGPNGPSYKGAEVLLRWQDAELGAIRPDEAVLVAELLGLMPQLTRCVIHSALREFSLLIRQGLSGSLSINLTPSNLLDSRLAQEVENALQLWNIPGERIIFEITESAAIEDLEATINSLQALKALGCKLALDDFGTGYASLSYLKRLPIDELKIDQSFIRTIIQNETDAHIVESVIKLAHTLGLSVVAEGVEDQATLEILVSYDCNLIQGYYFSSPLSPGDLIQFCQRLQPVKPI